jgi:DNA-directed RNA polymerase subunit alpha
MDVKGPCELTARDIPLDDEWKWVNPELHIATLNAEAHLQMTLNDG